MKMQMYAIQDTVTERFAPPFLAENDNAATRSFLLSKGKQPFPDDFALYLIGSFCEDTGKVDPLNIGGNTKPVLICDGEDVEAASQMQLIKEPRNG